MASEEPLFDPSLKKKKKKKAVAFSEDPLGADADPTTPAPPVEDPDAPATVHEQMRQNDSHVDEEKKEEEAEESEDDMASTLSFLRKRNTDGHASNSIGLRSLRLVYRIYSVAIT